MKKDKGTSYDEAAEEGRRQALSLNVQKREGGKKVDIAKSAPDGSEDKFRRLLLHQEKQGEREGRKRFLLNLRSRPEIFASRIGQ